MTDLLLPEGTRMIHIGPSKTGSTAIQNSMFQHRDTLREHGVVYASAGSNRAREAGWAVVGGNAPLGRPTPRMERWHELVREVEAAGDLRVAHSNEDYGRATAEEAATIVDGVGGGRGHVVHVVRRLDGLFPSYWQERVKAREARPYQQWLKVVLADRSDSWQWANVRLPHDVQGVVQRWGSAVGPENLTLIVADGSDRSVLPRSFEELLGLPAGTLALDEHRDNRSLTFNEAELLRRFNKIFRAHDWSSKTYADYVQGGVVRGLRHDPRPEGHQKVPAVPAWAHERITELANAQADAVLNSGVRVIGDPEGLRAVDAPIDDHIEDDLTIDLETAARMAEGLLDKALRLRKRERRERRSAARTVDATVADTASLDLLKVVGRRARDRFRRS